MAKVNRTADASRSTDKAEEQTTQQAEQKAAPSQGSKITPLKKLTIKTICGGVKIKDIPEGAELAVARIAGTAKAVDHGESSYGPWEALVGEFAATNKLTGEIFVGKTAFIPGAMGEALIAALNSAQADDAAASLKFSVDISVVVSARDANKYEYITRPVIETDVRNEAVALLGLNG